MSAIRLQVLLAKAGIASRRHAEQMISSGRVRVNGDVVRVLGTKVDPDKDAIAVDGRAIEKTEPKVIVVLYKPDDVMTTLSDPEGRETVADLVKDEPYKLRPVGRLDYHTEGVLLLTTDGELANRLLHPRHHVPKTYLVKVGGHPDEKTLRKLRDGIELEDGRTRPAIVERVEEEGKACWLELILTEGRNRLVRRMCEAVHHRPLRVVRTAFATIDLGDLRPGQYRYLLPSEKDAVYRVAGISAPAEREGPERAEEEGRKKLGRARRRKGLLPGEEPREIKGERSASGEGGPREPYSRSRGGDRGTPRRPPRGRGGSRWQAQPSRRSTGASRTRTPRGRSPRRGRARS
jgi:23S rRNA pseudouridine2605 synthase